MQVITAIIDIIDKVGDALVAPERDAAWVERVESRIDSPPSYMRNRLI